MGIERRIGHTKKEEGIAFLLFAPKRPGAAWRSMDHGSLPLAALAMRSPGLV